MPMIGVVYLGSVPRHDLRLLPAPRVAALCKSRLEKQEHGPSRNLDERDKVAIGLRVAEVVPREPKAGSLTERLIRHRLQHSELRVVDLGEAYWMTIKAAK